MRLLLLQLLLAVVQPGGVGHDDPFAVVRQAHTRSSGYHIRGGILAPASILDGFPPEARAVYDDLPGAYRETRGGHEYVCVTPFEWFGSADGRLRVESRGIGFQEPLERVTNVTIWTDTRHIEGVESHGTPSNVDEFVPLTIDEAWAHWSARRTPFERLRTSKGGYIELVSYVLRILSLSDDSVFGTDENTGVVWGRSDRWQVYLEADAVSGEVQAISIGIGSGLTDRHEYEGRLPEPIYPARHPLREFNIRYDLAEADESGWWIPEDASQEGGYWKFDSAARTEPAEELFAWHDPDWDRNSVHDPVITQIDSKGVPKTEPIFVPSKTSPGKMVPNSPASNTSVVLLAAGAALVLAGGILVIRRKTG